MNLLKQHYQKVHKPKDYSIVLSRFGNCGLTANLIRNTGINFNEGPQEDTTPQQATETQTEWVCAPGTIPTPSLSYQTTANQWEGDYQDADCQTGFYGSAATNDFGAQFSTEEYPETPQMRHVETTMEFPLGRYLQSAETQTNSFL
ncbi:unnamed protein product, partial [Mesorhabditis spiculigera]